VAAAGSKGYQIPIGTATIAGCMAGAVLACGLMAAVGIGSLVRAQLAALVAVFVWAMAVEQVVGGVAPAPPGPCRPWPPPPLGGADSAASMPPIPPDLRRLAPAPSWRCWPAWSCRWAPPRPTPPSAVTSPEPGPAGS
jgi:hypothetical protein